MFEKKKNEKNEKRYAGRGVGWKVDQEAFVYPSRSQG